MKSANFTLVRYDADEGKVFDWAEPHTHEEEKDGEKVVITDHLNAKTLFLSITDSIENYIEVDAPAPATEEA